MALTDNLIAFWELEEASGTREDAHGANDLTDNNTVGQGTGKVGSCADFEEDNAEFLSISDNPDVSVADEDFTWQAWIKPETLTATFHMIVSKDGIEAREYSLYIDDAGFLNWAVFDSGAAHTGFVTWGSTTSAGVWTHVIAWHDSVNNQVGIVVDAGTPVTSGYSFGCNDGGSALVIGAKRTDGTLPYDGLIDQVGFWNRVLTSDERTQLYNSGNGLSYAAMSGGGAVGFLLVAN